jgi:hypothetical protein
MPKKAYTLEDFEGLCQAQKLKAGEDLLDIRPQCCPGEPIKAHYAPETGLVTLKCSKCDTEIIDILTASITAAIYYQCLQATVVEVEKTFSFADPVEGFVLLPQALYDKIKEVVGVQ